MCKQIVNICFCLAALGLLGGYGTTRCVACACEFIPPNEQFRRSSYVFAGIVRDRHTFETTWTNQSRPIPCMSYSFEITHLWVGDIADTLTVSTYAQGSMCGDRFNLNEQYVIYAYWRDGELWTGKCGHNSLVSVALWEQYSLPPPIYEPAGVPFPKITLDDLSQHLTNYDRVVRSEAYLALAYLENDRDYAIKTLREILREERPGDPILAISSYRRMEDYSKRALPDIVKLLEHSDSKLRVAAMFSLGWLADPQDLLKYILVGIADPDSLMRDASIRRIPYILAHLDDETCRMLVSKLIELLDDETSLVRGTAVSEIGHFKCDASSVRAKLEWIAETDPDRSVRKSAERALDYLHR